MAPRPATSSDLAVDHGVAALEPGRHDGRVAGVDDVQPVERLDVELQRVVALRVGRRADGARPEAGARTVADPVVERRADDGDVGRRAASAAGSSRWSRLQNVGRPT